MIKKKKAKIPLEFDEQALLVQWLTAKKIRFASTPNENHMSKLNAKTAAIQGIRAKKTGMQAGFPDITIFLEHKILFIEMKRSSKTLSTVSEKQAEWIEALNCFSYASAAVCYGAKNAISFIELNRKGVKDAIC